MGPSETIEVVAAMIMLGVISWLIGVDANKHGRSGVGWGLLTFFTCFVAIPIYFLLVSRDSAP
jgi:hypothetical protein